MGSYKFLDMLMEQKINSVHTAYLAKVLSVSGNTAKIQPLGMYEDANGKLKKQSVLSNVPIAKNVWHYTLVKQTMSVSGDCSLSPTVHPTGDNVGHIKIEPIKAGDIVVCICCESNISDAKKGENTLTVGARHSMSDSVIIALL